MNFEKIIKIEKLNERMETIDIEVSGDHLFYANNILTHNSAVDSIEFNHSHIGGGISKIQTADTVIGIFNNARARERGEIEFQLLKTRNSGGVDQKIILAYDIDTLRITDHTGSSNSNNKNSSSSVMDRIARKSAATPTKEEPAAEDQPKIVETLGPGSD